MDYLLHLAAEGATPPSPSLDHGGHQHPLQRPQPQPSP